MPGGSDESDVGKSRRLDNPRHEAFCRFWVFGNPAHDPRAKGDDRDNPPETRGNGYQSYIAAGYVARGASARVNASRLLAKPNIQVRIGELRDEEQRIAEAHLTRWKTLLPRAQRLLLDAIEGTKEVSGAQVRAAREVIEQAQGPTRLRFGAVKGADAGSAPQVTIWSGKSRGKDE